MLQNRKHFTEELNSLNERIITMGEEVIEAYEKLLKIEENIEYAKDIIDYDKFINDIEVSINVDGYLLIAKQCPVAGDLRRVITAIKIANDLERIADYAVNIAKYYYHYKSEVTYAKSIEKLAKHFLEMLKSVMIAFMKEDTKLALDVDAMDEVLDKEYESEIKEIIKIAYNSDDATLEKTMKAVLALKQLERAGDHVTNIAESIVYLVTGKRIELN